MKSLFFNRVILKFWTQLTSWILLTDQRSIVFMLPLRNRQSIKTTSSGWWFYLFLSSVCFKMNGFWKALKIENPEEANIPLQRDAQIRTGCLYICVLFTFFWFLHIMIPQNRSSWFGNRQYTRSEGELKSYKILHYVTMTYNLNYWHYS